MKWPVETESAKQSGDDHGSRAGCNKIDASIISSGTATKRRCVEAVDSRIKLCHAWTLPRVDEDASWSCQRWRQGQEG